MTTREEPTKEQFDEVYTAVGRALSAWSSIEHALCTTFTYAIITDPWAAVGYAHASYWAVESLIGKLNMVDAAVKLRCYELPEILKLWSVIYKRMREKNNRRNELAHGTVIHLDGVGVFFIPSPYKTFLFDIPKISLELPLLSQGFANKLTAAQIGHRTRSFEMFAIRFGKFNANLKLNLEKTPLRLGWPLAPLGKA